MDNRFTHHDDEHDDYTRETAAGSAPSAACSNLRTVIDNIETATVKAWRAMKQQPKPDHFGRKFSESALQIRGALVAVASALGEDHHVVRDLAGEVRAMDRNAEDYRASRMTAPPTGFARTMMGHLTNLRAMVNEIDAPAIAPAPAAARSESRGSRRERL